jgi:dolichol-phosphate mannosyltransferase
VVVPTFCEAANLPPLVEELDRVLAGVGYRYEIIVVDDDSPDETTRVCRRLGAQFPLSLVVRREERGLATAVVKGLSLARGVIAVVMDADLSHPPGAIPAMVRLLEQGEADFVLGSRYVAGGTVHRRWSWQRRLNAWLPRLLVWPLTPVRDPLSGFFAFRLSDLPPVEQLAPVGFKIGLELAVRGAFQDFGEVPIHFGARLHGETKLSLRTQLEFLIHVAHLYRYAWAAGKLRRRAVPPTMERRTR